MATTADRFWAKVNKNAEGGCWLWTASCGSASHPETRITPMLYGQFAIGRHPITGRKRTARAHRWAWEETNGSIPPGLFVLHRCDQPLCVRPAHLFLGTAADNTADMMEKGRHQTPRWATHPHARIDGQTVVTIRRRRANGESCNALAREYGLSGSHVSRLTRGLKWANYPDEPPE